MEKTKYRIVPIATYIDDLYLQFYYQDSWRFVPKFLDGYVIGKYMTHGHCPRSLPIYEEASFMHASHDQETYELIPFAKKYENIQTYFDILISKRKEYMLKKKNQKEKSKIIYL